MWASLLAGAGASRKAGERVFVAGPPEIKEKDDQKVADAWVGKLGGSLLAVDAATGKIQQTLPLDAPPVWDGLAAAYGAIYLTATDGSVRCVIGETK